MQSTASAIRGDCLYQAQDVEPPGDATGIVSIPKTVVHANHTPQRSEDTAGSTPANDQAQLLGTSLRAMSCQESRSVAAPDLITRANEIAGEEPKCPPT